ncbi:uncharacterized protein BX664DRAFT_384773 [Halteromyces radiatus]|uniref:uncharacterized protein n=1 Tax=Halteromyces radiatus TaxID=101107 RepID=UPI002220ABB4|nr:uncharacterized protein BX664DRAFT_384773 [Halteromyces radiatus]KAI8093326.1 hypothetical protein BX664DRAFT_384773 [Halteromyces radiatus]
MFNQFKEQASKFGQQASQGASKLGQQASQGASAFGKQASTFGQQAGRSVNTFAESNNINTPVMGTLTETSAKASRILQSFIEKEEVETGFDNVIPVKVIQEAKGLAIFTVVKAGFLVAGKAGNGIVVSRLPDGRWSAPSAIATGGVGFGFQAGANITDIVLILNSDEAVNAFKTKGNVSLGGDLAVSIGPLGSGGNYSATSSKGKVVPMYSYVKSKGLFAGLSVEGTGLFELPKTNAEFYGRTVKAEELLEGKIDPPQECQILYDTIKRAENRDPY